MAGTLSANAGEPVARRAILIAPATVAMFFRTFCAGTGTFFAKDHDSTLIIERIAIRTRKMVAFMIVKREEELLRFKDRELFFLYSENDYCNPNS